MTIEYGYDPDAAAKADDVASRIDLSGMYIGKFKVVHAMQSAQKGTQGVHFEFTSPGGGSASFDLWTQEPDWHGTRQLQAMQTILGLRGLKSVKGKFMAWDSDANQRVETEGDVFPELMEKDIGLVLQKEKYTKNDGKEAFRMNLYGIFHPVSKLTASELKEGKVQPEKLDKMVRSLKDKDSRKAVAPETPQPSIGGVEGGSF